MIAVNLMYDLSECLPRLDSCCATSDIITSHVYKFIIVFTKIHIFEANHAGFGIFFN